MSGPARPIAILGPTSVGKTEVALALGDALRARGEDPVAISCDAIAVYRGLEITSGAPSQAERERLEHRLVGIVEVEEEFSAGRFAELAHAEIDAALEAGRTPILVGGTGLYMRAALCELDLAPPVSAALRRDVEAAIDRNGPERIHALLSDEVGARIDPRDRKRIARARELELTGAEPPELKGELWTKCLRNPALLVGLEAEREWIAARVAERVRTMAAAGAAEEVRAAARAGASRTARAALGFDEFPTGDLEQIMSAHRRYARRQLTWMRKMPDLQLIDRTNLDATEVVARIVALRDR